MADPIEYTQTVNTDTVPPAELEYRSAASELFVPDNNFVRARLAIFSWENKFQLPDENVVDLIVHASRVSIPPHRKKRTNDKTFFFINRFLLKT